MIDRPDRTPVVMLFFRFGSWKLMFWTSKDMAARERVNKIPNPLTGAWWRVPPPMVVLPPLLSISDDDLSSGGLGCSIQTLEGGDRRLL